MADKRLTKLRQWAVTAKKDAELWEAANKAASDVHAAFKALAHVVGWDLTSDYLYVWAGSIRAVRRKRSRRSSPAVPSITGRYARNAEGDAALKAKLRNPPIDANGRPQNIAAMARIRAFGEDRPPHPDRNADHVAYRSARKHLTRLQAEVSAEDRQAISDYLAGLGAGDAPNLLGVLATLLPPKSET